MQTVLPNPFKEGYDEASGRSWRFVLHDELIKFRFTPFVTWGVSREISRRAPAKSISRKINKETGELLLPDESRIIETVPLLTDTSKMGAYSFSIAAGPPSLGGTCPCSTIGFRLPDGSKSFRYLDTGGNDVVGGTDPGQQDKMRRHLRQLMPELPDVSDAKAWEHLEKKYICNGCSDSCMNCHAQQNSQLRDNKSKHSALNCSTCHSVHRQVPQCTKCHKPHEGELAVVECNKCHRAHMPQVVTCADDIPSKDCAACHKKAFDLVSASMAKHKTLECAFCHKAKHRMVPRCQDCHGTPHPAAMIAKFKKCGDCHSIAHNLS